MKTRRWLSRLMLSLVLFALVWPAAGCRRGYRGGSYTDVSVGLGWLGGGGFDWGDWGFWDSGYNDGAYYDDAYYDDGYYDDGYYYEDGYEWYEDDWKKKNAGASSATSTLRSTRPAAKRPL